MNFFKVEGGFLNFWEQKGFAACGPLPSACGPVGLLMACVARLAQPAHGGGSK
jgi:hypothetical protein